MHMIEFTGRCGQTNLNQFRKIFEEQFPEAKQHDNSLPSHVLRRPGDVVSGGQVRVQQAQKLRKVGRQLTTPTYAWGW